MDTKDAVKCGADKLMLTASEAMVVSELLKDLVKLDSVTVALQSESLTMSEVRDLFDHSISKYPAMKKYLSSNASILNNPVLERALVKLQSGRKVTPTEKAAKVITGKEESGDEKESQVSFAQQALKRRRLTGPSEVYVDTAFILPTSNICERLFSQSKLIFTDQRRVMKPATLEMLVLLKANCTLW
ncbi:Ribonuclease H-like domain [Phytophthora cactorum]|nr:Ribonuclease H-like domain [Phytophthora cactorum]